MRPYPALHCRLLFIGLTLMLVLMAQPLGASHHRTAPGFYLIEGTVHTGTDVLYLDMRFLSQLGSDAREALESGIPLTLELQVHVIQPRYWWWDQEILEFSQRQELRYHALSRRYVVHNRATGESRTFFRRDLAISAWSTLESVPILRRQQLEKGVFYELQTRVRLDLDALPHPLRTVAYVSPDWRLASEWYTWPLEG